MTFLSFIREKVSGVVSILQTRISQGSISLTIEFSGSREAFVEKIKSSTEVPFAAEIVIDETDVLIIKPMQF